MATGAENKDQQHPLWGRDRQVVNTLLQGEATDYNLVELGRLRIRYQDFPGARDIQKDLDQILERWGLTEADLFAKTREIHAVGQVYKGIGGQRDDWN